MLAMETKLNKKVNIYLEEFKKDIVEFINTSDKNVDIDCELCKYLSLYKNFKFEKSDFNKKTRAKNTVCSEEQCQAIRANKTQCTRRKREGSCFCGTHIKGAPNGTIPNETDSTKKSKTVQVYTQEINGINYYIDDENNIYDTEDVLKDSTNPKIVGQYTVNIVLGERVYVRD